MAATGTTTLGLNALFPDGKESIYITITFSTIAWVRSTVGHVLTSLHCDATPGEKNEARLTFFVPAQRLKEERLNLRVLWSRRMMKTCCEIENEDNADNDICFA